MATQQVGLHDESVKVIEKYARAGESRGDTAARLLRTADGRLTATRKFAKRQKSLSKKKSRK